MPRVKADRLTDFVAAIFDAHEGGAVALGHFTLAFHGLPFLYAGLALIVIGTGMLKPNISTLVGGLYERSGEQWLIKTLKLTHFRVDIT